jgi:beta-glucanase (GH16 family)
MFVSYRLAALLFVFLGVISNLEAGPPGADWELVFEDDFSGSEADLDAGWEFQNGPSGHILCRRWRENAKLEDGLLRLVARKEQRGGQEWTAASLWTREQFQYGYFECRYRYAAATGTNNSFWIMTRGQRDQRFEIDINEGHYPNLVNMNLHNWTGQHWARGGRWFFGAPPPGARQDDASFQLLLEEPVVTDRLRFVSPDPGPVRVMEVRVFPPSSDGYPSVFPSPNEFQPDVPNLALSAVAEASSVLEPRYGPKKAFDGGLTTASRWVSDRSSGPHHLTLRFPEAQTIACLQVISGWQDQQGWRDIVDQFHFESWDGERWCPIPDSGRRASPIIPQVDPAYDLSREFHVYALEWNEQELIYYFDGQEIRRQPHDICHGPAAVWLSLAILRWAGSITDAIDGTSMDVDYVRIWQRKTPSDPRSPRDDPCERRLKQSPVPGLSSREPTSSRSGCPPQPSQSPDRSGGFPRAASAPSGCAGSGPVPSAAGPSTPRRATSPGK